MYRLIDRLIEPFRARAQRVPGWIRGPLFLWGLALTFAQVRYGFGVPWFAGRAVELIAGGAELIVLVAAITFIITMIPIMLFILAIAAAFPKR